MTVYYNENDRVAAAWLRALIDLNLIAAGDVDERSIEDVRPSDLDGYSQCHFFAGIGGWPYALRLAGWPDDEPVWTGSCPCQPFSAAGNRLGVDDPRHLWPVWRWLVDNCRPATIFGEQVASADGRKWFSGVRVDLERMAYGIGCADLCAASVGAPNIRQRLYWVADSHGGQSRDESVQRGWNRCFQPQNSGGAQGMGNAASEGSQGKWGEYRPRGKRHGGLVGFAMQIGVPEWNGATIAVKCSDGSRRVSAEPESFPLAHGVPDRMGALRGYGNAINPILAAAFIEAFLDV